MPDDHLVDVGLGELLRLDLVLLRGAQQVVEERHVELQHLDELDQPAVGDVELAVEVEGARVGVRAVLGDLAVVDVAGQLGGVLVLLVLRLEGADPDPVLLAEQQPLHVHVLDHLRPVAVVAVHVLVEHEPAGRAQIALDEDAAVVGDLLVDVIEKDLAELQRHQVQRLLVHRAGHPLRLRPCRRLGRGQLLGQPGGRRPLADPVESVKRALRSA